MGFVLAELWPGQVLSKGEHAGFEWVVMSNGMGYRCGYVRVPSGHPWHGKDYDRLRRADGDHVRVHGGLTFGEDDTDGFEAGHWFGFDCAHSGDARDGSLPLDEETAGLRRRHPEIFRPRAGEVIRSQAYVEAECRSLCDQARAIADARAVAVSN